MVARVYKMSVAIFLLIALLGCSGGAPSPRMAEPTNIETTPAATLTSMENRLLVVAAQDLFNVAAPPNAELTPQELARVVEVGAALGFRTGYYRNGCQSRAHALWAALPTDIRSKVGKIWLFQPSIYAPILKQRAIPHPDDNKIAWDFHVALSLKSDGVERILDLALGKEPMSSEQWLKTFRAPDKALLIRTDGKYYSYNVTGGAISDFYEYNGKSCKQSWMIEDVAFDKVGAQLLARPETCPTLAKHSSNAIDAKKEIKASDFSSNHPGAGCAALKDLFFNERTRILSLVDNWAKPEGCSQPQ